MEHILCKFDILTARPEKYLSVQNEICEDIKDLVKLLYDETKTTDCARKKSKRYALNKLIIEDFDEEQIWQQIEMKNCDQFDQLVWQVSKCIAKTDDLKFPIQIEGEVDDVPSDNENNDNDNSDSKSNISEMETDQNVPEKKSRIKYKPTIVDDKFFKLKEMEEFLLKEEKSDNKAVKESDEEVDLFQSGDESSDDENRNVMYTDFFGEDENDISTEKSPNVSEPKNKNSKRVRFSVPSDDMSSDNSDIDEDFSSKKPQNQKSKETTKLDSEKKSEFELRQQRLKQQMSRLEEKSIKDAPWQLKGEIDATKRPQNSLLEEVLDFDLTTRPPPIITEQTTFTLEDIIKQRIKDKAWDDVERKQKPVEDQLSFKKQNILDHSKSKLSLAQIYEAEYLKQKQALSGDLEEEKEPEAHTEIRDAMTNLFSKLDALCHYHYTPRAPHPEIKIVSNIPAISMEEVAPVAVSDAALLAPEEIKTKNKGDLLSKEERTKTDKNRERRKKKKFQRSRAESKSEKVTNNRNTKMGAEATKGKVTTTKQFFQQLNDNTSSLIPNKRSFKNKR